MIQHTLRESNNAFETLSVKEFVAIPCTTSLSVSYDYSLRLEREGVEYYYPAGSNEKYSVLNLLGKEEDETLRLLELSKIYQGDPKSPNPGK